RVRKTFGTTVAVEGMDLAVPRGALYGVIGPNGAGKTTCIRMIMSILFPDSGELSVLGQRSALEAKDRIGYLPEERGVYRKMKVGAFLTYVAQLKGLAGDDAASRVPRLLQEVGLPGVESKRCEDLSKGMLQRVQFLGAIIHQPDLLILDEPFSGQDPVSVRILRDQILKEHRRGATVLLSTHVMANAEEMCQHVVMIHQGRKVLDEAMSGLRRQFDPRTIHFEPLDANANPSSLSGMSGVERVESVDGTYRISLMPGTDPAVVMARLATAVAPARIELARLRLEDVFVRIVAEGEHSDAVSRALRASVTAPGPEGALA
ncbi:MAG TPA: ATP-binding cassette domain-containing protein, partial [Vicinamibacterales bacterium]|nr:ATP-binding cassette domain-containing protein [Vicinamibacterales bacterium]